MSKSCRLGEAKKLKGFVSVPVGGEVLIQHGADEGGDSSSPHAQSRFVRLGQHLGHNPKFNALRRNLENAGVKANKCLSFILISYCPILPEQTTMAKHLPTRDIMAGLEKPSAIRASSSGMFIRGG